MRIAFISTLSHLPWGGSELLWYRTAVYAKEQGHDVMVSVYNNKPETKKITELKIKKIKIHKWVRFENKNDKISSKLLNYLKRNLFKPDKSFHGLCEYNPDIICISQASTFDAGEKVNIGLQRFITKIDKPFIFICQNNADLGFVPSLEVRWKIHDLFLKAKKVLFVSKRNYEVAKRQLASDIFNYFIISNPVNISDLSVKKFPDENIYYLAQVAALTCSHKGQDYLLNILSQKKWKNRNWILNLYGEGGDKEYLFDLIKYYDLQDRVKINGHAEDIDQIWKKNHILILPSLGEGTPLALQEAMLSGRTSVVTDVGGNSELVIDNETGFLCQAPSVKLFDETLERAWQNKHKWKEMGEKAFFYAKSRIDLTPEKTLLDILSK
jgi:glycosyltransferase involved in cell wall biosynthesis